MNGPVGRLVLLWQLECNCRALADSGVLATLDTYTARMRTQETLFAEKRGFCHAIGLSCNYSHITTSF